jgi:hypothetical protein
MYLRDVLGLEQSDVNTGKDIVRDVLGSISGCFRGYLRAI